MGVNAAILRKFGESAVLKMGSTTRSVRVSLEIAPEMTEILDARVDGKLAEASLLTSDCNGLRVDHNITCRGVEYVIARIEDDGDGLTTLTLCED